MKRWAEKATIPANGIWGRKDFDRDCPKVIYETNGAYTVTLHVKDGKGNYAMAHKLLTIEAEPLPKSGM